MDTSANYDEDQGGIGIKCTTQAILSKMSFIVHSETLYILLTLYGARCLVP